MRVDRSVPAGDRVVIELGLERGEPATYASPQRATTPVWFGPALIGLLVLLCAGASNAPVPAPLSAVFSLQAGPADAYALTADGQLLAQVFGTLTSYDLKTGRLRWQSGDLAPSYRLRTGDGLVLIRPFTGGGGNPGTTAVSVATGDPRWQRADTVLTLAGSTTLLAVTSVRSVAGAGRRVEGAINAVDPLTGTNRWTVDLPSTGVVLSVPGPSGDGARLLLIRDDRVAILHDLGTGAVLAVTVLPPTDYGPDNPVVAGGRILLLHQGPEGTELSAYDPESLRPLWSAPAAGVGAVQPCGTLACLIGPVGIRAVDPATGAERWSRLSWQALVEQGATTIVYGAADGTDPIGLIDPQTGRVLVALGGWRPVAGDVGDRVLLTRTVDAGARTMVAVVRPGDLRPRLLAELPAGTGDCQAVPARLVCRSMYGELVVWAYRQKG